ncbi:hypothetical protein OGAPHI_000719 [Ogataea philodendri]|uniref:candidapepsin n=1 Tax=Ogataea philodendri TaxID=1378263 RepID=A0A9P8PEW4_9ASCO|nr:uncharacterized protein OGAPHI_000719 [Ogataea philodendri]KAH3671008.1 hypothetical protein OGAPHI_000719 [Ogataea philodendri]
MKLLPLALLLLPVNANVGTQFVKLEAAISRGDTFKDSVRGAKPYMLEKRADDGSVTMELKNTQSFYEVELGMGSDNQTVGVLLDTGSSDLWVMNSNNSYCSSNSNKKRGLALEKRGRSLQDLRNLNVSPGKAVQRADTTETRTEFFGGNEATSSVAAEATLDCSKYGTFDPDSSNSFHKNGTDFAITYADKTFANGVWGYDDISFGGVTVEDFSFAVADDTDSEMGVFGIGFRELETTYSSNTSETPYIYQNLPFKLVDQGLTNKAAYSVYLNSSDASTGTVLFGAVDHSKYTGTLGLVPIINTAASAGYKNPIQLEITLSAITASDGSGSQASVGVGAAAALFDTGTTLTYAPSDIIEQIAELFQLQYSSSAGAYVTKCSSVEDYTLNFDFQGQVIEAPLSSFLVSLQTNSGSTSSYCALGIFSSGDSSFTLGDSFLQNVYFVADLEDYQLAVAPVNLSASSEDLEAITSGIPSASSVSAYSSTWGVSASALDVDASTSLASITSVASTKAAASTVVSDGSISVSSSTSSSSSSSSGSGSKAEAGTISKSVGAIVFALVVATVVIG